MVVITWRTILAIVVFVIGYYITSVLMDKKEEEMKKEAMCKFCCTHCNLTFEVKNDLEKHICPECSCGCVKK